MKSKMLLILYGRDNVLDEDISCASVIEQSEKVRQGINCVELPETLGSPRLSSRARVDAVKKFITGGDYRGRLDAYGRPENMRPILKTFVVWHTRNPHIRGFLEDPTGNRRFLPMPILAPIDEEWLRNNREQLWAEVIELEQRGRREYNDTHPDIKRGEEKFTDIFLPEKFYEELAELGCKHMKEGVKLSSSALYESLLKDLISQPFVLKRSGKTFVIGDDVRSYLNISEDDWKATESIKVTAILTKLGWKKNEPCLSG